MTRRLKQEHLKMIRVEASKDEDALGDEEEGEGTDDPAAAQLRIRRPRHSGICTEDPDAVSPGTAARYFRTLGMARNTKIIAHNVHRVETKRRLQLLESIATREHCDTETTTINYIRVSRLKPLQTTESHFP